MKRAITLLILSYCFSSVAFAQSNKDIAPPQKALSIKRAVPSISERRHLVGVATGGCSIGGAPISFDEYCKDVEQRIKIDPLFSQLSSLSHKNQLTCNIELDGSGGIAELGVAASSGSAMFDQRGLDLLSHVAPFGRPRLWHLRLSIVLPEVKVQILKDKK